MFLTRFFSYGTMEIKEGRSAEASKACGRMRVLDVSADQSCCFLQRCKRQQNVKACDRTCVIVRLNASSGVGNSRIDN